MTTRPENYTVGWICAIPTEFVVACELLDEEYKREQEPRVDTRRDTNSYKFGRIYEHQVVIACLPRGRYGTTSAALVARDMRASFPAIRFGLMVGIGGGAPSQKDDIRLGDVVISAPTPRYGGVIQYDYGKAIQNHEFEETGHLDSSPEFLLNALSSIETTHDRKGHRILETITGMLDNNERLRQKYARPDKKQDRLYKTSYIHSEQGVCDCQRTDELINQKGAIGTISISGGERDQVRDTSIQPEIKRGERKDSNSPAIHYGLIASANRLMKDAVARDAIIKKHDVLCFEMEAAGLMNSFPCLVVRGICDYSDTHKNDAWQGYAAAAAAAYAKELLEVIPGKDVVSMQTIEEASKQTNRRSSSISSSLEGTSITRTHQVGSTWISPGIPYLKTQPKEENLRDYLDRRIQSNPMGRSLNEDSKAFVIDSILYSSGHMYGHPMLTIYRFSLATLQVQEVLDAPTIGQVKEACATLPSTMDKAFDSALLRIQNLSSAKRELAMKSLMWIAFIKKDRSLKMMDLTQALGIRSGQTNTNTELVPTSEMVLNCCCGLVDIYEGTPYVRFVHPSIREHLQKREQDLFPEAHKTIASVCLEYLRTEDVLFSVFSEEVKIQSFLDKTPLLWYAVSFWGYHISASNAKELVRPATSLLHNRQRKNCIHQTFQYLLGRREIYWDFEEAQSNNMLHMAALFGLEDVTREILELDEVDIDAKTKMGSTALIKASAQGHITLMKMLLKGGANPKVKNWYGDSVRCAREARQEEAVQVLLQHAKGNWTK